MLGLNFKLTSVLIVGLEILVDNQIKNLVGFQFFSEKLKDLLKELHAQLIQSKGNPHVSGQFQWMDGQLVKALKNGHWLLIDNVNFCR